MMATQTISKSELDYLWSEYRESFEEPGTIDDSPLLRLFVSSDRGLLIQSLVERTCIPGEVVFREAEVGDTLYLIRSGRVAVIKGDPGAPIILGYRGAGEIIGEMALLEGQARSASVIALEDLRLLGLNRQSFQQLLNDTPSVSASIMEILSARLRESDEARSAGEVSEKHLTQQVFSLQDEQQRLEELGRLREETSDLIIHDLRNPLSTVSIAIKMLAMGLPEDCLQENQELLSIAESGCRRMQRLVDSLLDVSRMEAGEIEFNLSFVDLGALINNVVRLEMLSVQKKGIDLQIQIDPGLPIVMMDMDRIERVLANLLDNAIKFTLQGGKIVVAADVQGEYVLVSVDDDGPGIPVDERERIFERFAQVEGERPKRRGFGLGLAYCRLAVEAHGGRIWVEPGAGGLGSRFVFTLKQRPGKA